MARWNVRRGVIRSIHSSGGLIMVHYMDRQHFITRWPLWTGMYLIHESRDLVYVAQHDFQIKALNKGNTQTLDFSRNHFFPPPRLLFQFFKIRFNFLRGCGLGSMSVLWRRWCHIVTMNACFVWCVCVSCMTLYDNLFQFILLLVFIIFIF